MSALTSASLKMKHKICGLYHGTMFIEHPQHLPIPTLYVPMHAVIMFNGTPYYAIRVLSTMK